MSATNFGPTGHYPQPIPIQHLPTHEDTRQDPVLVLFNGAYILPSTTYERAEWGSDAQIAARRAMSKRSSRSYAGRVSRARSKKKEMLPRPMMPTLDTSFVRLKGAAPRQVYPKELDPGINKAVKKHSWFGLGTPGTRGRGLGITKGTPQPEQAQAPPLNKNPKTADSLTSSTKNWLEISPSDRPIPIGISLPSDSVADISPYQSTRQRSESDATLVTPSIIITPAVAMKSVCLDLDHDKNGAITRKRNDTLDSAGTTFEDMEYEMSPKNRTTSTATMFEEDEVPLRDKQGQLSALTPDTSTVPTPRRSRGWWNVITTPFEFSRSNSTWTQNVQSGEKIPDMPEMPQRFGGFQYSPSTSSTYIWSATEKSPSTSGDSPMVPMPLSIPSRGDVNVASPLSAMSASPVVGTATIGTVLMPRQVSEQQQQPIHINIELLDRRPDMHVRTSSAPVAQPIFATPQAPQSSKVEFSTPSTTASRTPPQPSPPPFPPPPHFSSKSPQAGFDYSSRSSSPVSYTDAKGKKKHRKAFNFMDLLPSVFRQRRDKKQKKKRRSRKFCWGCCCCLLILILLAILVPVVVVITRKHNNTGSKGPVQTPTTQWLNLTGYPPIPTGISTIAQPEDAMEEPGCIAPPTVWSCSVPKEDQQAISPNKPDQPNFELQIIYDNSSTSSSSKTRRGWRAANPVSAGAVVRSRFLNVRAAPAASPAPPSIADYQFLGNTTDDNEAPFEGEDTPFFISFLDPKGTTSSRLLKRADAGNNLTSAIPPPQLNSDGTAAPANLLPLTSNQSLRLFNRGKDDEHYGFFVYYDRSIFLKSISRNGTLGGNPADVDGGASLDAATLRCTWAQTRFLVQIWTKSEKTKPLLGSSGPTNSSSTSFQRPGSFPYPVTVTIDRHGGSATDKMAYCYTMDNDRKIQNLPENKQFLFEDRTFGGTIVNPSKGPDLNVSGPIDGGHGGCSCQWQNWLA
ncbi:hypothetical protein K491DRAFT_584129 [Lophiostoma macrostomum CBS 122681]|uniref:Glycoprotease family protein n=1 Tax=Lophiostoma macrostomum CBS 122681 TaxID=1314788 RepID=A0A6A6TS41_9PLEO|nr:hypothetical protein K491DRAFT_584129 [Lophiostoma macrostomum CBS 122681]